MTEPGRIPSPDELADRSAIAELLDTYAAAVDARDWPLFRSLFSPEAVLDYTAVAGPRGGVDEVARWLERTLSHFRVTQHHVTSRRVTLDGDRATARASYYNPMGLPDADGGTALFFVGGSYALRLGRSDGRWRIDELVESVAWTSGAVPKGAEFRT